MRSLRSVDATDASVVLEALRRSLDGGDAVFPRDAGHGSTDAVPDLVEDRVALVVETSGSSARPKRVAISADAVLAASVASETALDGPGQWLLALPAFYIAGINVLLRSISAGTIPIALHSTHFVPESFVEAARQLSHPMRFTSVVPVQLAALVELPAGLDCLRRFDRVLVGGQAAPAELIGRALEEGVRVTKTYGASETCGGCVYDGVAIGDALVRIVDGEVELSGSSLADGYLDDPERTAARFHVEQGIRWYRTGDSGELSNGVLRVTGRLDDVIISGGVKVSLGELEAFIFSATNLDDAVVVGAANAKWGEVAVVVSTKTMPIAELRSLVSGRFGAAAAPDRIVTLAQVPLLPSGKPDRLALRSIVDR